LASVDAFIAVFSCGVVVGAVDSALHALSDNAQKPANKKFNSFIFTFKNG
jgi:3-deoxy-D-arabino-heptulosonate 7-phosphate (DAHP) synthase